MRVLLLALVLVLGCQAEQISLVCNDCWVLPLDDDADDDAVNDVDFGQIRKVYRKLYRDFYI